MTRHLLVFLAFLIPVVEFTRQRPSANTKPREVATEQEPEIAPQQPTYYSKLSIESPTERLLAERTVAAAEQMPHAATPTVVDPTDSDKIQWHIDLDQALAASRKSRRPVLLFQLFGKLDEPLSSPRTELLANVNVAAVINNRFEPVWQSVRALPRVTIDFGDGHVVERTLHGNVATYACSADGQVLDILPGVYAPGTYRDRLVELARLHDYITAAGEVTSEARLLEYHRRRADALANDREPDQLTEVEYIRSSSIVGVEYGVKIMLVPADRITARAAPSGKRAPVRERPTKITETRSSGLVANTHQNEAARRLQIHRYLSDRTVQPGEITKWVYREVLHADLDDPYAGLLEVLSNNYPFEH